MTVSVPGAIQATNTGRQNGRKGRGMATELVKGRRIMGKERQALRDALDAVFGGVGLAMDIPLIVKPPA